MQLKRQSLQSVVQASSASPIQVAIKKENTGPRLVTWSEIVPLLGPSLTEEEKNMPMWQMVIQENFKTQKEHLKQYLTQVFTVINSAQIGRWKSESFTRHRPSFWTRRAGHLARKQASITLGSIAGAIAIGGGEAEIAEIMRFE